MIWRTNDDDNADQAGDTGDLDPRLCRLRFSDEEPECSEEELRELDDYAPIRDQM